MRHFKSFKQFLFGTVCPAALMANRPYHFAVQRGR